MRLEDAFPDVENMLLAERSRYEARKKGLFFAYDRAAAKFPPHLSPHDEREYFSMCEQIDKEYGAKEEFSERRMHHLNNIRGSIGILQSTPKYRDPGKKNVAMWYVTDITAVGDTLERAVLSTMPGLHLTIDGKEYPMLLEYGRMVDDSPPIWYARAFTYTPDSERLCAQVERPHRLLKREGDRLLIRA